MVISDLFFIFVWFLLFYRFGNNIRMAGKYNNKLLALDIVSQVLFGIVSSYLVWRIV